MRSLLHPEQALAALARRFERTHLQWWAADLADPNATAWPLTLPLGLPTEVEVARDAAAVRAWAEAWLAWAGPGDVRWQSRQWARLGAQQLPAALVLANAADLAQLLGHGPRWQRAQARRQALCAAVPALAQRPTGARVFEALADWHDDDVGRLTQLLAWVAAHPASGLYLRQLPVVGMHTKWIERRRGLVAELAADLVADLAADLAADVVADPAADLVTDVVTDVVADLVADPVPDSPAHAPTAQRDLHGLLGLRKPPVRLRVRLLCDGLRATLGGLGDIEAPLAQIAALPLAPRRAIVVENLETGLALPPMAGTVAFMKLGHAVSLLGHVPWLRGVPLHYWGDIDSHGFAMLARLRQVLPQTTSLLMDQQTWLDHRALWVQEPQPLRPATLPQLTHAEQALFDTLAANPSGQPLRLEQERLPWAQALLALQALA